MGFRRESTGAASSSCPTAASAKPGSLREIEGVAMIRLGWRYGSFGMILRTLRTKWFCVSDHERWKDLRNHDIDWDKRTRAIADLIPPGSHVIDFGAGRRQLEHWLPAGCSYTPSDIVERGSDTLLCDLNRRPL